MAHTTHTDSNGRKYVVVVKGDTLWGIAKEFLGGGSKYPQLATWNNISNPNLIYINQKIYIEAASSSSSSSTSTSSNKATIDHFGQLATDEGTLFALWSWSKSNTASYKVLWTYTLDGSIWFTGTSSTISVDKDMPEAARQSTYSIPDGARSVKFKVKPISETKTSNNKETSYWTADWSTVKTWTDSTPLATPGTPSIEIEKYKLTTTLENITIDATQIEFQIVKNNSTVFKTGKATIVTGYATYSCTVDAGGEYKVRCRAVKGSDYSDWSAYSSNASTIPAAPSGIATLRASSETSVYLEWAAVPTAETYDIEYTTESKYFDGSNETTTQTNIESTHYELTGLESGDEYFFRIRAKNSAGESGWSTVKSVVIGKEPAAPTTWSSTTTAIVGDLLTLYWVHNSEDGSSQTYAELELYLDGVLETHTIKNTEDEEEKDKTSFFEIDTSSFKEGMELQWRVRTAGITKAYGDWSTQRTVDIYARPTLDLSVTDANVNVLETIEAFPFYIRALPGPPAQAPIGYHVSIVSNEIYETVDNIGNDKIVNKGEEVYSKHFDISQELLLEMSAGNIDLENNVTYTVKCTVSMDSGLTAESSVEFTVAWTEEKYTPNAEIGIDPETYTASIRPYCNESYSVLRKVELASDVYTVTDEEVSVLTIPADEDEDFVPSVAIDGALTSTGEQVYQGTDVDGNLIYYCTVEVTTAVEDVLLSVYRREFDGTYTELGTGLDSTIATTITDPHPALDLARYRIVATSKTTGAVSYYDPPGYPVGAHCVIIQWNEAWSDFDAVEDAVLEQPPWSGSMLKLPYNIDVSDNFKPDVSLIEYLGREHPTSYYGTQRGSTSSWNVVIPKDDEETLYALRRLARWMGDVYVREPSGSGYWANVNVSFSQKHLDLTIPVTLEITRVEGGV